jgi:Bifunctional DNA primase/polymerase, N-terminal/Primase C terminal 2 (PriCT-2)
MRRWPRRVRSNTSTGESGYVFRSEVMARTKKRNPGGGVHPHQGLNRRSYEEPYNLASREREVLKAALEYATQGWPVFPCKPDPINKKPLTKKGFKDATIDPQIIEQWWRRWPDAMIGVPMGSASGIFCVDLDRKKPKPGQTFKDGVATWAEYVTREGAVTETRQSETPSTGQHLLFRHQDGIRNVGLDQLGPGLEIKGEGGYIIVPPSRHAEGVYRWINETVVAAAPDWLIQKILTKHEPRKNPDWLDEHIRKYAGEGVSTDPCDLPSPPTRERIEAALGAINPDIGRAEWIAIGCALYTQFGEEIGFELWDGWSSKGNKYREREMPGHGEASPPATAIISPSVRCSIMPMNPIPIGTRRFRTNHSLRSPMGAQVGRNQHRKASSALGQCAWPMLRPKKSIGYGKGESPAAS